MVLMAVVLALAGCFSWDPGEDPAGKKLLAEADPVAKALKHFHESKGAYPRTLADLVPVYIPRLPSEPELLYDLTAGSIRFTYSPSWPQAGQISCFFAMPSEGFLCHGYL
jgi:hypothetical protein